MDLLLKKIKFLPVVLLLAVISWSCGGDDGLAASAAGFLVQAGLLPTIIDQVWDTSSVLSVGSIAGRMLHVLIGYNDRPAGIELLFYVVTLVTILGLMRLFGARSTRAARAAAAKEGAPA